MTVKLQTEHHLEFFVPPKICLSDASLVSMSNPVRASVYKLT